MSTLPSVDLQENAERNLSIAIGRLEEMRWAVSGVDSPSTVGGIFLNANLVLLIEIFFI